MIKTETKPESDSKDNTPLITQIILEKVSILMTSSNEAMKSGDIKRAVYLMNLSYDILKEYIEMIKICNPEAVRDW